MRQPPVPAPEQCHRTRNEQCTDDGHIDDDRRAEPEPELLQTDDRPGDEAHEGGEHDQAGRGHNAPGLGQPERHRGLVVPAGVPLLAHPAHEEDLVVHGQTEHHRKDEDRDPALDLVEGNEPERATHAPLEEDHQQAVGGSDRKQVQDDCFQREDDRTESPQQEEIREDEHPEHQPGKGAIGEVQEVDPARRAAAGVDGDPGGEPGRRDEILAQAVGEVERHGRPVLTLPDHL